MKKRIFALLGAVVMAATLAGCQMSADSAAPTATTLPEEILNAPVASPEDTAGSAEDGTAAEPTATPDADLSTMVDKIYAEKDPGIMVSTRAVDPADTSWLTYYTGLTDGSDLDAAVASEALIGSQAYSLVLARVTDRVDATALAQQMLDNVDPVKWICVQANDLAAAVSGNTILVVMVDTELGITAQDLVDAFAAVTGSDVTTLTRTAQ